MPQIRVICTSPYLPPPVHSPPSPLTPFSPQHHRGGRPRRCRQDAFLPAAHGPSLPPAGFGVVVLVLGIGVTVAVGTAAAGRRAPRQLAGRAARGG